MNSTSTQGLLPDPKYQAWVEQSLQKLAAHGRTDEERRDWLMNVQGMADTTASKFIPAPVAPVQPTGAATALSQGVQQSAPAGIGQLMRLLGVGGDQPLSAAPSNVGGALLSGVRGATLGATDNIPALDDAATAYRQRRPGEAVAAEMMGGLVNPFKWLRTGKGVIGAIGRFMAPEAKAAASGLKAGATRILGNTARGGAYGGIYGLNVGEGEGRIPSAVASALGGSVIGFGLGTIVEPFTQVAATKSMRAQTGLSPKSRELIREHQITGGGLRDPATLMDGELLIDRATAPERSLVHEALRRSPEGLTLANRLKNEWITSQQQAPQGLALEVAGVSGGFPNPILLAERLRTNAKAAAAPKYARLGKENPALPMTPELRQSLEDPAFSEFLTSKEFQSFARTRNNADKVRALAGENGRGSIMPAEAVAQAVSGEDPRVAQMVGSLRQVLGMEPPAALVAQIRQQVGAGPVPVLDWRTLHTAKLAMDQSIRGEPVGALANMARADILVYRDALMKALKQAPGYEEALNTFAGGHVMADMLEAGQAAARKGPAEAEALLADPAIQSQGRAALNQARLGILAELHRQLGSVTKTARASGDVWTPDRIGLMKLAAETPEQAASVDAFVGAQEARWSGFGLVPQQVQRIQTGAGEQAAGAIAGAAISAGTGTGIGFRLGNIAQRVMGKMTPAEALDIVRTYFSFDPKAALRIITTEFPRDAARAGELGGRMAGLGVTAIQP